MSDPKIYARSAYPILLLCSATLSVNSFAQTDPHHRIDAEDEIIVTGTPLSATAGESLVGVTVMRTAEIAKHLDGSLGETLKSKPGISSTFFGPGASRPIIRGQGGDRIRVLDNGVGSIDASAASPDHASAVEPAMASRIEVVRGAGLLRYGSSASSGVINVIDGRIPDHSPDTQIEGVARIAGSTMNEGLELASGVNIRLHEDPQAAFVMHLEGAYRKTNDYKIPGFAESEALRASEALIDEGHEEEEEARDVLENSATEASVFAGGLSYIGTRGFFGASIKTTDSEYGVPSSHDHEEDHEEEDHDEDGHDEEGGVTIVLDQTRIDVNGQLELDGYFERLSMTGGVADYQHQEIEPSGEVGTIFSNEGYEARFEAVQNPRGPWSAAYGLQVRKREFSAIGEEAFVPPVTTKQTGVYMFNAWEMGALHLEAAGRYEWTSHESTNTNTVLDFDGLSLSAGADYHLSDTLRLGGLVYSTRRAPASEELFSNGPHLATQQFERGDMTLDLETATGVETTISYKSGATYLTLNGFLTDYKNYVYARETNGVEDGLPIFQFTADDAVFKGFELDTGIELGHAFGLHWDGTASAEYVQAEISNGVPLPRIPPFGATIGISAKGDRVDGSLEVETYSSQNDLALGELPAKAYTFLNAFMAYDFTDRLRLRVAVKNITDQTGRQQSSFLKDTVPLPGRNLRILFEARF